MKKIIGCFLLAVTALNFVSCDDNNPNEGKFNNDPEMGFVSFVNTIDTLRAGCGDMVPIQLQGILDYNDPVNTDGFNVLFTVTDVVGSTEGLNMVATVPAGSRMGWFSVTNTEHLTEPVEFTVTITGTDKETIAVGDRGNENGPKTVTVRLFPGAAKFAGTYEVTERGVGLFNYSSGIEPGAVNNEIIITNLFGEDADSETRVIMNADGTFSFPAYADNYLYTNGNTPLYVEGLSAEGDPCAGTFKIDFNLRTETGAMAFGPISATFTRKLR